MRIINPIVLLLMLTASQQVIAPPANAAPASSPVVEPLPKQTYEATARALLVLKSYQSQPNGHPELLPQKREVSEAINVLERKPVAQALEAMADNLDFMYSRYSICAALDFTQAQPVVKALIRIGKPAQMFVVEAVAKKPRSRHFLQMAIITLFSIDPRKPDDLQNSIFRYADEYAFQANRLHLLADALPAPPVAVVPQTAVPAAVAPAPADLEARIARLARIFELQDVLADESKDASEARSIAAIEELGKLQAVEAALALADKLDWEVSPGFPEDTQIPPINAAALRGRVSPAITEAAKRALEQIGPGALPAIIEASAMRYRLPRFRANAVALVVKLSGGETQARAALEAAAQSDAAKSQRLRDWIKQLTPPAAAR